MSAGFEDHFDKHGPRPPREDDAHSSQQEQEVSFRNRLIDPWNETELVELVKELAHVFQKHFPSYVHSESFGRELQSLSSNKRDFSKTLADKRDQYFSYEQNTDSFKAQFSQEILFSRLATGLAYIAEGEPEAAHLALTQASELLCDLARRTGYTFGKHDARGERESERLGEKAYNRVSGAITEALYGKKARLDFGMQILLEGSARLEGMLDNLLARKQERPLMNALHEELTLCCEELGKLGEPKEQLQKLVDRVCGPYDMTDLESCCFSAFHMKNDARDKSLARVAFANSVMKIALQRLEVSPRWEQERRSILLDSVSKLHADRNDLILMSGFDAYELAEKEFWSPMSTFRSVIAARQLIAEEQHSLARFVSGAPYDRADHTESLLTRNQSLEDLIKRLEPLLK